MRKKNSVLLIILLSHISYSVKTFAEGKPTMLPMPRIEVALIDSNGQLDTFKAYPDEFIDDVMSAKVDSMANDYYIKTIFNLDSLSNTVFSEDNLVPGDSADLILGMTNDLTDSLIMKRLADINSFIDLSFNSKVREMVEFYTKKRHDKIETMLGLTSFYFPMIEETLDKYKLPLELKYMAVIESAMNARAVSRVGASGMWQFMYKTGKLYDLEVNSYIDERYDPIKATDAAARYLKDLYSIYGDWHLVIAAYNCGPGNINRAIARTGGKQDYWEIYSRLPRETRGYVPAFIAAAYTVNYYKEHNLIPKEPVFNITTDTIVINSYLNLNQVATVLNLDIQLIRDLNPIYKKDIIPATPTKTYALTLPEEAIIKFIEQDSMVFAYNRSTYFPNNTIKNPSQSSYTYVPTDITGKKKIIHTVKSGDVPGAIAEKYHVRLSDLKSWNNMRGNMIRVGQKLVVYVPDNTTAKKNTEAANAKAISQINNTPDNTTIASTDAVSPNISSEGSYIYYTVRSGDNLWDIAKQYPGTSAEEIRQLNKITNTRGLYIGQKLKIMKK